MVPSDQLGPLLDGASCTACGATVPTGRIRVLARRDDLSFLELHCTGCGSRAIGLLVPAPGVDTGPVLDVAVDPADLHGMAPMRDPGRRPISASDVALIREHLAAWDGDLVGWLGSVAG